MNANEVEFEVPEHYIDCVDLSEELLYKYFQPQKPLTAAERKTLMRQYNMVAEKINTIADFKAVIILTPSTRMELPPREEGKELNAPARAVKAPAPKAAPAPKTSSVIGQIIALHLEGKSKKDIIAAGYNKSTVNRQVGEYIKKHQK